MATREAISKRLRFEVFKRDSFRCIYCGKTTPQTVLEIDHVVPVSKGGKNQEPNLVTSCFDCNRGKSDVSLGDVIPGIDQRMTIEMERRDQLKRFNAFLKKIAKQDEAAINRLERHWFGLLKDNPEKWEWTASGRQSARVFLKHLPEETITQLMSKGTVINARDPWRYLCGVLWRTIKEGPLA
jgi:hypothetical protein